MPGLAQLESDVREGVRIVHEFDYRGERYRAYQTHESECRGTVFMARWLPDLMQWDLSGAIVDEDAALVLDLARTAGRVG